MINEEQRRQESLQVRVQAAEKAQNSTYNYRVNDPINGEELSQPVIHQSNGDENLLGVPVSFTKGLSHEETTGLVASEESFDQLVKGIDSGDPVDFKRTPLGPASDINSPKAPTTEASWHSQRAKDQLTSTRAENPSSDIVRAWESSSAGLAFDLEGPDAQAVTMPPAPKLGSDELTAEMAEVYMQAVLRDKPFAYFNENDADFIAAIDALNGLSWFAQGNRKFIDTPDDVTTAKLSEVNAFRGIFRGDLAGPYISQFLLIGNTGINGNDPERGVEDGLITYGAINADQRVRYALEEDYMTTWEEWLDVQNGADFRGQERYVASPGRRFIATPRDLSTYVHYDALYEAYLNACLILLGAGASFDPGIPFQQPDARDHQQGFALYGGPHILTLVTEVATRALKAVRYQKFNTHRRCRPEVLAARMEKLDSLTGKLDEATFTKFLQMDTQLEAAGIYQLLEKANPTCGKLLPMAFVEGSPMHPSYGAGHATVAGACTTILKAWFNHSLYFNFDNPTDRWTLSFSDTPRETGIGFQAVSDGSVLDPVKLDTGSLTIEGELNKVAANISIGRDWAGVHYYSDYVQSMIMGEEIAIKLLQEQSLTYPSSEQLSMTLPKFDGSIVKITNGEVLPIG